MDDGGRRCGAVTVGVGVVVVVVVDELLLLLRENERGWVGGAVRVMIVLPASLSSLLSLGEGGGEAVVLLLHIDRRRNKTPLPLLLPLPFVKGVVELVAISARTISAFVGESACKVGPTMQSPLGSRGVSDGGGGSAGTTAAFAIIISSSSRCFLFLIAKSFNDILTFGVTCGDSGGGGGGGGGGGVAGDVGGGSASGNSGSAGTDAVRRVGEDAGLGDTGRCRRQRGSEDERGCGDDDDDGEGAR